MTDLVQLLVSLDASAIRATDELRWGPATTVLVLSSAWWVKGPLLVAAGWCADVRGRRLLPLAAFAASAAFLLASGLSLVLKAFFGRSRPPEAIGIDALVAVPGSPSFPSGHAMTAFAAAGAVAVLAPRLRWAVLAVAAVVGFSRVYLGVHFWLDVLAGAAVGLTIGLAVAWPLRQRCGRGDSQSARSPARSAAT
jgi:undecaprenyl-diphosphatase